MDLSVTNNLPTLQVVDYLEFQTQYREGAHNVVIDKPMLLDKPSLWEKNGVSASLRVIEASRSSSERGYAVVEAEICIRN